MLFQTPSIIGVGVTEAGIAINSIPMRALLSSLVVNSLAAEQRDISIINTDNVMNNGQGKIRRQAKAASVASCLILIYTIR